MPATQEPGEPKSPRASLSVALGAGLELVVAVILGIYGGSWADAKLGTKPWLTLIGFILGTGVGFYQLLRSARLPPSRRP